MKLAKSALIAAALTTLAPLQATAAFVDHQAVRACFARAQFALTQNSGDMVLSDKALIARKDGAVWRVKGDLFIQEAAREGTYRLDCEASASGVSARLALVDVGERRER